MPEKVMSVFLQSWRTGTQKRYEREVNEWFQLRRKLETDPMQPSVSQILEFLQMLNNSDIGYSGFNSVRSWLSSCLTTGSYEAGKHPLVCKYMKGVFNINPLLPKYKFA